MPDLTFLLPDGLSADAVQGLERAYLAGGPDNMPWACDLRLDSGRLILGRINDDSGYLACPWPATTYGRLMTCSATLMDRNAPYDLLTELARGKINQLRNQSAEWAQSGLHIPEPLKNQIHQATLTFGRAVCSNEPGRNTDLQRALDLAFTASEQLVRAYSRQVYHIRHNAQDRLHTGLSCRVGPDVLQGTYNDALSRAFNRVAIPMPWHLVEAEETIYDWSSVDRLLDWAEEQQFDVSAGPLIDFSSSQLPPWLWAWEADLPAMATFMGRFIDSAVRRYRARIRRWQLTAASNWATVLNLTEEELLGLTFRLGEAARSVDSSLELSIGIAQPWGEYMALSERTYSPFVFADNLVRSGLNLQGLNLELVMGASGRGSYHRDLLETSRLLDLYSILGVGLQVTLGCPSSSEADSQADPELRVGNGVWKTGYSPENQADWASAFADLALCKRAVHEVRWTHLSDRDAHVFPCCGLINRGGQPLPALGALEKLRKEHL